MKSWIFSFQVGNSHHYMENRFLLGDPGLSIQRAFRLWRWKRYSFSCHWHSVQSPGYLFLSVLHRKRHFAVKQWNSIREAFTKKLVETQSDNIRQWHLLSDPALPQLVEDLQWSETRSFLHLAQDKSSQMLLRWPILFLQHFEAFALYGR